MNTKQVLKQMTLFSAMMTAVLAGKTAKAESMFENIAHHAERDDYAGDYAARTLAEIRRLGMKAGVALNPATSLSLLDYVLDDMDMVLIMSVNPGFGGQKFLPCSIRKVAELRAKLNAAGRADCLIQVDGGVNLENTGDLVHAGADVLVSGSAFFGYPPFGERLNAFMSAAQ